MKLNFSMQGLQAQANHNAEVQLSMQEEIALISNRLAQLEKEVKYLKWQLKIVVSLGEAIYHIPGQKKSLPKETNNTRVL